VGQLLFARTNKPIAALCQNKGLKLHLDGARIFNALAKTGDKAEEYGKYF